MATASFATGPEGIGLRAGVSVPTSTGLGASLATNRRAGLRFAIGEGICEAVCLRQAIGLRRLTTFATSLLAT